MADAIELAGGDASFGDGILLEGRTLYVVQNFLNQVAVVSLAPDLGSGVVTEQLTDADFNVPTVARFGAALYAVNARFNATDATTTESWLAKVSA